MKKNQQYQYSNPLTSEERDYLERRKAVKFYRKQKEVLEKERSKERSEKRKKRFDVALANRVVPLKRTKDSERRSSNRSRVASNINNNILRF